MVITTITMTPTNGAATAATTAPRTRPTTTEGVAEMSSARRLLAEAARSSSEASGGRLAVPTAGVSTRGSVRSLEMGSRLPEPDRPDELEPERLPDWEREPPPERDCPERCPLRCWLRLRFPDPPFPEPPWLPRPPPCWRWPPPRFRLPPPRPPPPSDPAPLEARRGPSDGVEEEGETLMTSAVYDGSGLTRLRDLAVERLISLGQSSHRPVPRSRRAIGTVLFAPVSLDAVYGRQHIPEGP
jgi:hypothetical protein